MNRQYRHTLCLTTSVYKPKTFFMTPLFDEAKLNQLKDELNDLDREFVDVDGIKLKPSQCYRFETDPAHILFNTNCPGELKNRIDALMMKYLPQDENSAS